MQEHKTVFKQGSDRIRFVFYDIISKRLSEGWIGERLEVTV